MSEPRAVATGSRRNLIVDPIATAPGSDTWPSGSDRIKAQLVWSIPSLPLRVLTLGRAVATGSRRNLIVDPIATAPGSDTWPSGSDRIKAQLVWSIPSLPLRVLTLGRAVATGSRCNLIVDPIATAPGSDAWPSGSDRIKAQLVWSIPSLPLRVLTKLRVLTP